MLSSRSEQKLIEEISNEIVSQMFVGKDVSPMPVKEKLSEEEFKSISIHLKQIITAEKIPLKKHDKFIQYVMEGVQFLINLTNSWLTEFSDQNQIEQFLNKLNTFQTASKEHHDRFLSELGYTNDDEVMKRIAARMVDCPSYISLIKYIAHQTMYGVMELTKAKERIQKAAFVSMMEMAVAMSQQSPSLVSEQKPQRREDLPPASMLSQSMINGGILHSPTSESISPKEEHMVKRFSPK